jgi:hypothetical protein
MGDQSARPIPTDHSNTQEELEKIHVWGGFRTHGYTVRRSRVSSGSIVSDYGLDDRGSIPGGGKGFFL